MSPSIIRPFFPLNQILPQCLANLGIAERVCLEQIRNVWPQIVGHNISNYTQVMDCTKGKLTVQINEPGWKEALESQAAAIVQKINSRLTDAAVREISFFYHPSVKPPRKAR